ncbi:hypothetical protein CC79DRAFT_1371616 [Sarocladium strictum]
MSAGPLDHRQDCTEDQQASGTSSLEGATRDFTEGQQQAPISASMKGVMRDRPGSSRSCSDINQQALVPGTALSSSDTFGSELKSLLISRSQLDFQQQTPTVDTSVSPAAQPRWHITQNVKYWPTEEDAYAMLDIVVLNVGISQQIFDARVLSDNLSTFYDQSLPSAYVSDSSVAQCLLVFAIGRLLQARWDNSSEVPGQDFFNEALNRIPSLGGLRKNGVLGIELMGLCALYLQVSDRKDDAYVYASTALRLAIGSGLHRSQPHHNLRRSEYIHRNRLWWSIYMQERRLAAAVGAPMAISDKAITAPQTADHIGYSSAAPISANVKLAQITGRITATIYSHNHDSESAFIKEVQDILQSLYLAESSMPSEISGGFNPSDLLKDTPLSKSQLVPTRTAASLYLTTYQTVIYAVRPILLYLARSSLSDKASSYESISPTLRRLADICVDAARKSLVILQGLQKQEIIGCTPFPFHPWPWDRFLDMDLLLGLSAKHAFLDLDCLFSAGFVYVLAVVINPAQSAAYDGISSARSILRYLSNLGNRAAAKRLAELDQMWAHLAVPNETPSSDLMDPELLMQTFSFGQKPGAINGNGSDAAVMGDAMQNGQGISSHVPMADGVDGAILGQDMADIVLEGESDLYWMYNNPSLSLTGVELADWERLETHINTEAHAQ